MAEQPTVSAVRSSQATVLDTVLAAGQFAVSFLAEKTSAPENSAVGFQPPLCCATILSVVILRC